LSLKERVLLCCEQYPPSIGGIQEVIKQIAERLAHNGIDVTVATSQHPDRDIDTYSNGVRVVSFPIFGNQARGLHGPIEQYRSFLLHGNFDAILIKAAQQWTFDAAIDVIPQIKCKKLFIPCGFSGLNNPLYADYFQKMPEWLALFDGLIFYSSNYQDIEFAKKHGLSPLFIIPNGADEREFQQLDSDNIRRQLGIDPNHDVLLTVGSRIANKGHWEVIRAFRKAHLKRPATLVINANSPGNRFFVSISRHIKHAFTARWPLSWLAWFYNRLSKHKRTIIVDLSRHELVRLYKTTNLFVFASHVEYSPLVLFEAAASGTPFIASIAGNSREIAEWTSGGIVVPSKNKSTAEVSVIDLSLAIEKMLSDPLKLEIMGQNARRAIWENGLTWEQIVPRYRRLLLDDEKKNPI
jgi:glycosyltransferase involved in cell wall biosynthesis